MKRRIISFGAAFVFLFSMFSFSQFVQAENNETDFLNYEDSQGFTSFENENNTTGCCSRGFSVEDLLAFDPNTFEEQEPFAFDENCFHSVLYDFDNQTMTVNGVYEQNTVLALLEDIAYYAPNHFAIILKNGEKVTGGYLEEGMIVRVYHGNQLAGEYVIPQLLEPYPDPLASGQENLTTMSTTSSHGFTLPIDNIILSEHPTGNISRGLFFSSEHKGIDIATGPNHPVINGATIRCVKNGTVYKVVNSNGTDSWGTYVKINHGNGIMTLYGHMQYNSAAYAAGSSGQSVSQGTSIGRVGNTGKVSPMPTPSNPTAGSHLHFEVYLNGTRVDPLPYLQGAGNSGGSSTPAVSDGSYIAYGGHVYRVVGGAPVYVGSWANVGGTHSYTNVSAAVFNTLRQYPKDGTFVRDKTGKVYRFAGGAPIYVTDSNNLEVFGPSIYIVDSVALNTNTNVTPWNHVRKYPADGTYVQTKAGQVFRFVGGAPTYVSSWSNVGSPVVTPTVVDKNTLNSPAACAFGHVLQYPKDGVFVKDKTGKVYRFAGGAPIYVTDSNNLEKFGPNIYMVDSLALSTNSNTAPWNHVRKYPADGTFVQTKSGQIFRFAGGAPIFVSSWESVNSSALTPTVVDKNTINSPAACAFGHILQYPKDGTFVKTKDNHIFRFAGGAPIFVDSWDNVGGEANATLVDKDTLNQPDLSAPFNHVRRFSADGTLVRTISGKLFEFTNEIPVYQSTGENTTATLVSETGLLGNHFASAYELTLVSGETTAIDGCLGLASYSKFYKFTAPAAGTYTLGTSSCTGTLRGELYDANQTLLTQDSNGGTNGNFLLTYLFTEGETYFIKVQNSSSAASQTGSYTLNITAA